MNSHRDNVKDGLRDYFVEHKGYEDMDEDCVANLADVAFKALGITEDEQDMEAGYFMSFTGDALTQAKHLRNIFMIAFRDDRKQPSLLNEALSADDCYEIFQSILKGGSDITYKTLMELISNYDGGHEDFCLIPMNDEIKNALSVEEAMHAVMKEVMKPIPKEGGEPA